MPPRPRDPPPAPGLLASAFSFVTREIESFVTAAAGGEVQPKQPQVEKDQPEASSSRITLDGKRRTRDEGKGEREKERRGKRVRKRSEVESERARARRRVRREDGDNSDDERDRALRALKKKVQPLLPPRSRSSERESADDEDDEPALPLPPKKTAKKRREVVADPEVAADVANAAEEPEALPPKMKSERPAKKSTDLMPPPPTPMRPPPPAAALLATPAPTMPGSLFPRSASLMPETPALHRRAVPRLPTPPPPPVETILEEVEPEPEDVQDEHEGSPQRGRTPAHSDKARDTSVDITGRSSARNSSRHSDTSGRAASSSRTSLDEHVEVAPRPRSSKGKERACDTSGDIRVRGKERELQEAREDHARHAQDRGDGERERDKQRIRLLEEEVARLRAELALKSSSSMMPPPPPPPPPPPLFRPQAPTASAGGTENFLASARASLKRTDPPVEAPINSVAYGARTKKTGQPTVNVPTDKMAAFLREMKTVRLRRVGGLTGNTSMGPPASTARDAGAEVGELSRSTSGTGMSRARMAATLGERSFDLGVAASLETGAKRKRSAFEESVAGPSKRRETMAARRDGTGSTASSSRSLLSSSQTSAASSQSSMSSSSTHTASSRSSFEVVLPRSQPSRPRTNGPLRIWPTASTASTELTTPSLCSDNENDQEHEEALPDTPSDSGRNRSKEKSAVPQERVPKLEPEHEVIDVDALETPLKPQSGSKPPVVVDKKDLFARRPPASPLPAAMKSPDKPKPPARAAKSKIPTALPRRVPISQVAPEHDEDSESDDPLAGPPSRPQSRTRTYAVRDEAPRAGPSRIRRDSESSPSPPARSRPGTSTEDVRAKSRMSNHARRRLTLDEEMRRAGDSLWQPSDEEGADAAAAQEEPEPDVDSGELVAMGMRSSKRGFLARGGGAGAPVFMGEGYVQGASAAEWLATRGRSRSGTGESSSRSVRGVERR